MELKIIPIDHLVPSAVRHYSALCVPRAFGICNRVNIEVLARKLHALKKESDKKEEWQDGVRPSIYHPYVAKYFYMRQIEVNMSLKTALQKFSIGRYVFKVKRHVFPVINGIIYEPLKEIKYHHAYNFVRMVWQKL